MEEKNVLVVTGANGFLGRAIVSRLLTSGISVRATDLGAASGAFDIVYRKADIARPEELKPVLENVSKVIDGAGTGRFQTVRMGDNQMYWELIKDFEKLTGVPVVLNTSCNESEPIVYKPSEALDCFLQTKMDLLVLGNYMICRKA